MAMARFDHTATLLPNGQVLVVGGYNNSKGSLASAELYDPTTGNWSDTGSLANARSGHTATLETVEKINLDFQEIFSVGPASNHLGRLTTAWKPVPLSYRSVS